MAVPCSPSDHHHYDSARRAFPKYKSVPMFFFSFHLGGMSFHESRVYSENVFGCIILIFILYRYDGSVAFRPYRRASTIWLTFILILCFPFSQLLLFLMSK